MSQSKSLSERIHVWLADMRVSDFFILLTITLCIVSSTIERSYLTDWHFFEVISKSLRWLAVVLVFLKATLFTRYTTGELIFTIVFSVSILLSYYYSGATTLLITGVLVVGSIGCDYWAICKTGFLVTSISILIVVLLAVLGIIDTYVSLTSETSVAIFSVEQRNSFGFLHVNYFGMFVAIILFCRLNMTRYAFSIREMFVWVIVALFCFAVVNTKTVSLLIFVALAVHFLLQHISNRAFCIVCVVLVTACLVAGFTLPRVYDSSSQFLIFLNDVLTGRLALAQSFLRDYSVGLFGQNLDLVSTIEARQSGISAHVLDNAYIHLLLHYGLIPTILILFMFGYLLHRSVLSEDVGTAFSVALVFIVGLSETWFFALPGAIVLMSVFSTAQPITGSKRQLTDNGDSRKKDS